MTETHSASVLQFDSTPGQRQPLLDWVEGFCRRAGGDSQSVGRVRVVLDELFTNITSYAPEDKDVHRVRMFTASPWN
jgi:anti-sigma regulatory factor (Ser/Thr protein kinase)